MDFANYWNDSSLRFRFESRYDDVSEPLAEYRVNSDGSLTKLGAPTLLGVEKNGKWGWVNINNEFIIPPIFDSGFVLCYNGIIIMKKDGYYGALYRSTLSTAFQFRYTYLSHCYNQTFLAHRSDGLQALVKPGDIQLTDFKYIGLIEYNHRKDVAKYVRNNFFGMQVSGDINLETGRELS